MKTFAEIMTGLYLVSELLALVPSIKANSTFELIVPIIVKIKDWVVK